MKEGNKTKGHIRLEFCPPGLYTFAVPIWKAPPRYTLLAWGTGSSGSAILGQLLPRKRRYPRVEIRLHQFYLSQLAGFYPGHQWVKADARSFLYAVAELRKP